METTASQVPHDPSSSKMAPSVPFYPRNRAINLSFNTIIYLKLYVYNAHVKAILLDPSLKAIYKLYIMFLLVHSNFL